MSLLPRFLSTLALLGQLVASVGVPVPIVAAKPSTLPYPCQGKKCGCKTSEACWAGACCCFTMREKLTWAEAHGVNAPAHSRAIAAAEDKSVEEEHDCCAKAKACCPPKKPEPKPSDTFVWLSAMDVQGCQGKPADAIGMMTMPPAISGKFTVLHADRSPAFDWLSLFDVCADSPSRSITSPPPKLG
jgi:hypothetical protein